MSRIEVVLCPVDFTELSRRELALAVDVCEAFGARLVLHHNLEAPPAGLTRVWEWDELHRGGIAEPEAERRLRALTAELPPSVHARASLSHGPIGAVLLELAKRLPADLLVLGSHGCSTADHASVTERMIETCPCPVLTVAEGATIVPLRRRADDGGRRTPVVVPTDLSGSAAEVVDYAAGLARTAPLELHLLHVMPSASSPAAVEHGRRELAALAGRHPAVSTVCSIEFGAPVETILRFSDQVDAGFLVMGEHTRGFLLRLLVRDVARAVLHSASRPVWYVPPPR